MTIDARVEIVPSDLMQIVESVFGIMLGLEVYACRTGWFPDQDRLTSAVHLEGARNGVVLLECTRRQACRFASRFLSMDLPEAVDDVVRDVLGELANMIGGNLKCVLTRGIKLSTPTVVEGSDYGQRAPGANIPERLAVQSPEGVFWITVLTTTSSPIS